MIFNRRRRADPATGIEAFWAWWPSARPRVERAIADGAWDGGLVAEVAERVDAIHPDLAWEFGKGVAAPHALVVTAAGDRTLRGLAERWRRAAPAPDGMFEFAASRRADPYALERTLTIDGRQVDLSALRFDARVDQDAAQVDVRVWHPSFGDLPDNAGLQVAFLALDWLLGEDGVEIWVGEIETVTAAGPALTATGLAGVVADLVAAHREPRWAVLSGTRDRRPLVASIQVPLKPARWPAYDTHVRVAVPYRVDDDSGLPTPASLAALRDLEERIVAYVDGAALVAHETSAGVRTFHVYADGPVPARALEPIVDSWREGRVRLTVTDDPGWDAVRHLRP